ncbi:probable leucine-rich repeat receptor-like protein kinase At1g68400 [Solanum pennellii]|uniref:Probable leucine-rich repeat receptor-like protein kinase At1g68400 n=1 Tax=Solanum pennellii TaxID=28526 RepID=A0ABM1FJC6_SOLPN|nr:probable leucine-rich repeat receptor-like protein kinase At1g68400 [Solanum pennellii]
MNRVLTFALLFISFFFIFDTTVCDETVTRDALLKFLAEVSNNNSTILGTNSGWNSTSDPCKDKWHGVTCKAKTLSVEKIILDGYDFSSGTFDAAMICNVKPIAHTLFFLSLKNGLLQGKNIDSIDKCKHLRHLVLGGNRFSGSIPQSFSRLNNLKRLDISNNRLSGVLPDLSRISGLIEFEAQNNQLSGEIPEFDFSNLVAFNVSFNNFSGLIPPEGDSFPVSSYMENPLLCGSPLARNCSSLSEDSESADHDKPKRSLSRDEILMYSGYFLIGLALVLLILLCVYRKRKQKEKKKKESRIEAMKKVATVDHDSTTTSMDQSKKGVSNSDISSAVISSDDSNTAVSQSLVVLTSPEANNGLRFEDLLKAPAELLGRGKHGSTYKVMCDNPKMTLAVKRIKDWSITGSEFKKRMQKLDKIRHPNVLPAVAFYSSRQEKLLVYEYQNNGSLLLLLQGIQTGQRFHWSSRLSIAAGIADALAFMHQELQHDRIAHGNLKSSNIFLNNNMDPTISEYGLMSIAEINTTTASNSHYVFPITNESVEAIFKEDVYAFGVILLELLTGKVQNSGIELASWVVSVLREEWTVEVFDRTLIQEGASEERMVNLLQVAVKCVNHSHEARPSINQVALMVTTIRDEDDRSIDVSASTSSII